MKLNLIESLSNPARAAFYFLVAEDRFTILSQNDEGYANAKHALALCWDWVEGERVFGDDLYSELENEMDTGLMVFGGNAKDSVDLAPVWNTIITALMYTIWKAYEREKEKCLPQTIEEVGETIIVNLLRHARKSSGFDETFFNVAAERIREKYQKSESDSVDIPIKKIEILKLVKIN